MEQRENESRGAQKASSQAMVVEAAVAPVGRRDIAAMVGALAGLVATGCLTDADAEAPLEELGRSAEALTGTALRWVDTVLGSAATPGDLATKNSAHPDIANAIVVLAKGSVTAGDGGGGIFYWDSSSTTGHDGGTIIKPSAGGGRWVRIYSGSLDVRWFGARKTTDVAPVTDPDNSIANSNAIQDAIKAANAAGGGTVYIPPGTYVTTARSLLPNVVLAGAGPKQSVLKLRNTANEPILNTSDMDNCGIRDLGFDGNNLGQTGGLYQPVKFVNCNGLHIENIFINLGTDGKKGTRFVSAGLFIQRCLRFRVHNVEVTGNGIWDGIQIRESAKFELVNPYVHDMAYDVSSAKDDHIEGINIEVCAEWTLVNPRVHDLGGNGTPREPECPPAATLWSRGIQISTCHDFSILGGTIARVDQGIDVTGGENTSWVIANVIAQECYNFGFKFANNALNGQVNNCTADRCGQSGFVVSPPSGPGATAPSSDIQFVDCVAYDIGYNRNCSTHSGFRVQYAGQATPTWDPYPGSARGVRFIGCKAHDRQATPTMGYGFYNEVPATSNGVNGVAASIDGRYNEAIDCISLGHTIKAFEGMHSSRCEVRRGAVQSIPHNAWTPVQWTAHDDFGGMHDTTSNADKVYVRRDGVYRSHWGVVFESNGVGQRGVRISRGGVPIPGTTVIVDASKGGQTALQTTWTSVMSRNDTLRVEVFQDSGAPPNPQLKLQTTSAGVVEQVR